MRAGIGEKRENWSHRHSGRAGKRLWAGARGRGPPDLVYPTASLTLILPPLEAGTDTAPRLLPQRASFQWLLELMTRGEHPRRDRNSYRPHLQGPTGGKLLPHLQVRRNQAGVGGGDIKPRDTCTLLYSWTPQTFAKCQALFQALRRES